MKDNNNIWLIVYIILIFIILLLCYYNTEEQFKENFGSSCLDFLSKYEYGEYMNKPNSIFISIASYRDDECQDTLKSIYNNADNPNNIYIGICHQNKDDSERCDIGIDIKYIPNIRIIDIDYMKAKGPTYARYWCSTLWRGEEFFLQIDSHTHFIKGWDTELIKMYRECEKESRKPILSAYPPTEEQMKLKGYPEMCNGKLSSNGIPIFLAGWTSESDKPTRSPKPFAAGGFMFLRGNFLYEVPYDPNLSHLFQGEETLLSARLFTYGYDFYTPNIKVAWHNYGRKDKPKYWTDISNQSNCRKMAETRVLFLLGREKEKNVAKDFLRDKHIYGFGNIRTINDFWLASGIDFNKKDKDGICDNCNNKDNKDSKYIGWNFKKDHYKKIKSI